MLPALILAAALLGLAIGLVNPGLQPRDLLERHRLVLVGRIVAADPGSGSATAAVDLVVAGDRAPAAVQLSAVPDGGALRVGGTWIAFAGGRRPGLEDRALCYTAEGWWTARILGPERWSWTRLEREAGLEGGIPLAGTWCGDPAQLGALLADLAAGTGRFPCRAWCAFAPDAVITVLPAPATALVGADLDGDGQADLVVCAPAGLEALLRSAAPDGGWRWLRATRHLGLSATAGSVAAADADGDGVVDLLCDGVLRYGAAALRDRYASGQALAGAPAGIATTAFLEVDGDGWPEALAAGAGGLRIWHNPGPGRGAWTALGGLDDLPPGPVAVGDWDGDGRADLFCAGGGGRLLVADGRGAFRPVRLPVELDPAAGGGRAPDAAGVFAAFVPGRAGALCAANATGWRLLACGEEPEDRSAWGGELSEGPVDQRQVLSADFDLDGRPDLYAAALGADGGRLLLNRGYGMFLRAERSPGLGPVFSGPAHGAPGTCVAVDDLDGDGAPDLVLGGEDGTVTLLANAGLVRRQEEEEALPGSELAVLQRYGAIAVRPTGRGAIGAQVAVSARDGTCLGRWLLGSGGGALPALWTGVPAGRWRLRLRWADGAEVATDLVVEAGRVTPWRPRR